MGVKHTEQYVKRVWSIDGREWRSPHPYVEGVRVVWRGVRLVCTRGHHAGFQAHHPWDPGDGWPAHEAALLWTPDGPVETTRLQALLKGYAVAGHDRLCALIFHATGGA